MGINITITRDTVAESVEDILSLARAMGWSEAALRPFSGTLESTLTASDVPAQTLRTPSIMTQVPAPDSAAVTEEKRKRRTKAEMEAIRAAEAEQAKQPDSTSAQPVAQPKPDETAELKRIAGNVAEVVPPAAPDELDDGLSEDAAVAEYTRDDLRALLTEIKAGERGKEKVVAILGKFGVTTFGALPEDKIGAAYAYAKQV